MGLFSHKRANVKVDATETWDFISLNDFKSTSCWTPFAYVILWISMFLSVAVYAVDTFTAYQLLAFNNWSSQIEPSQMVNFDTTKWIFTGCIILSVINLIYEHIRANRIMRRGSVAESFLDHIAQRLECFRMGKGRGWKRFLVFAELTKSKKGAEYIALFTFFNFQSWVRVLLCAGPRQVLNGLALYSVYNAKLQIEGNNFDASLASFLDKIRALATEEPTQAVILSGMLFTVIIWVFSFLSLLLSAFFFVFFLWHYIPKEDGGLTGFCERKVNKRLRQIVSIKINKAMAEDEQKRKRAEMKAAKKNGEVRPLTMKPSLPVFNNNDDLPPMPSLKRAETFVSVSEISDRPSTPNSFEMSAMGKGRPVPSRTATAASSTSKFSSRQSLIGAAAPMGTSSRSESSAPTLPPLGYPPARTATAASNRSNGPGAPLQRMPTNNSTFRQEYSASPAAMHSDAMPSLPPLARTPTNEMSNYRGPGPNQPLRDNRWPNPNQGRPPFDQYSNGRASPAPSTTSYRNGPMSPPGMGPGPGGYPMRSATGPMPPRGPQPQYPPQRNMTAPTGQPYHRPTGSNGSQRSMPGYPGQPYHQQSASNSSLRSMVMPGGYQTQGDDQYEYPSRSNQPANPMAGSFQAQTTGDNRQPTLPNIEPIGSITEAILADGDYRQPTLPNIAPERSMTAPIPARNDEDYGYAGRSGQQTGGGVAGSYPGRESDDFEQPSQSNTAPSRSMTAPVPARDEYDGEYRSQPMPQAGRTIPESSRARETDEFEQSLRAPPAPGRSFTAPISPRNNEEFGYPNRSNTVAENTSRAPVSQTGYGNSNNDDEYGYPSPARSNTLPVNTGLPRGPAPPRGGNNDGWSQDLERGNSSRY
ncbi:hypothetical protein QBC35DRAFT_45548 [Podospora australis]|uniref:Vacuolar membrane protein n=1 Tax=Podospora australis TaxID=1536484 RepID=A0AAN6X2P2_9PEZI|nr:hypothetical protein QBC35DRAFT_45548 [Podospora australis]